MRIQIPKGRKIIFQIHIKGRDETGGSKSLFSVEKLNVLMGRISRSLSRKDDGNEVVSIKLIDGESKKSKSMMFHIKNEDHQKLIEEMKGKIVSFKGVECPIQKGFRYRIIVDNCKTSKVDKKALTIGFQGGIEECRREVEKVFKVLEKKVDRFLVFSDDGKLPTHRVIIHKSGSKGEYINFSSKSFSIWMPNYSSEEVLEMLRKKVIG